jgi:hypothetical protein
VRGITTALSGAFSAGKSGVCGGGVAPAAQLEGQSPSRTPRRLYCGELSGFVPPNHPRKLISVGFYKKVLKIFLFCVIIDKNAQIEGSDKFVLYQYQL